jgi:hypothetical protein
LSEVKVKLATGEIEENMIEEMTGVIMTEEIAEMIEEVAAEATGAEELVIEAVEAETEVVEREGN